MLRNISLLVYFGVAAVAQIVCTEAPYNAFLPLSNLLAAESFCSSAYPLSLCTVTDTSTVTSTETQTTGIVSITTGNSPTKEA